MNIFNDTGDRESYTKREIRSKTDRDLASDDGVNTELHATIQLQPSARNNEPGPCKEGENIGRKG